MGTPEFALPVLEGLLSEGYPVVGVYTRPDRPAGRGRNIVPSAVKTYALKTGIEVLQPPSLRGDGVVEELGRLNPESIIVAAYGLILPPQVLAIPPKGVLNIHPSLLPQYRGPSPVATALVEGASATGVTVMLMDQGMDTGPTLAQRKTQILSEETVGELTNRLFRLGAELLLKVLPAWGGGSITPVPQDEMRATTTRRYTKEDGELDWSLSAAVLERRIPGCYTYWEGKLLKILEGIYLGDLDQYGAKPGQVVSIPTGRATSLAVATGQGLMGLIRVQLEGRKSQATDKFVLGHPRFLDARLPS